MFDMIRRIKWKNITGLVMLVAIVFVLVYLVSVVTVVLYGDCVEEKGVKVCFSVEKQTLNEYDATSITVEIINMADTLSDATVSMRLSPNLDNLSSTVESVESMAPGDTVRREFRIAARGEKGRFKVEFDIDSDSKTDKEIFITVE